MKSILTQDRNTVINYEKVAAFVVVPHWNEKENVLLAHTGGTHFVVGEFNDDDIAQNVMFDIITTFTANNDGYVYYVPEPNGEGLTNE
jgi:hypothetical protein